MTRGPTMSKQTILNEENNRYKGLKAEINLRPKGRAMSSEFE